LSDPGQATAKRTASASSTTTGTMSRNTTVLNTSLTWDCGANSTIRALLRFNAFAIPMNIRKPIDAMKFTSERSTTVLLPPGTTADVNLPSTRSTPGVSSRPRNFTRATLPLTLTSISSSLPCKENLRYQSAKRTSPQGTSNHRPTAQAERCFLRSDKAAAARFGPLQEP